MPLASVTGTEMPKLVPIHDGAKNAVLGTTVAAAGLGVVGSQMRVVVTGDARFAAPSVARMLRVKVAPAEQTCGMSTPHVLASTIVALAHSVSQLPSAVTQKSQPVRPEPVLPTGTVRSR